MADAPAEEIWIDDPPKVSPAVSLQCARTGEFCRCRPVASRRGEINDSLIRRTGDELVASWSGRSEPFTARRKRRPWHAHQFAGVHALAAHVHRLYVPNTRLLDDGWVTEAMPLVRAAYESALTAHWIAQTDDGADAFLNEDVGQRRFLDHAAKAALSKEVLRGGSVSGIDLALLETSAAVRPATSSSSAAA